MLAAVQTNLCLRRRRREANTATGSTGSQIQEVPTAPVRRTREDDVDVNGQRQRVTTGGDYYARHQEYDRPTWHQRHEDQGHTSYTRLTWQRDTCETQAAWQQHPLWRMCGVCMEYHGQEYWIWNRCCARCAIPLCTVHATEMTHPTYIREREGDRELETTFYCGATIHIYCPQCLQATLEAIGDQTGLRHEQPGTTTAAYERVTTVNVKGKLSKQDAGHCMILVNRTGYCGPSDEGFYSSILRMPAPRRAQSEGHTPRRSAPPFVPGVSYSAEELDAADAEEKRRVEKARRKFLDTSLRDARPTPPTRPPSNTESGEARVIATAVPVSTVQMDTTATAQTSAVSHTETATMEPPASTASATVAQTTEEDPELPASGYLQAALNVLKSPFKGNKKRAHSGSTSTNTSSEVNPSPRVHLPQQQQEDHPMGQDTGDSTAEPVATTPTAEDENTKRLKVEESEDTKPSWFIQNSEESKAWNERQERLYREQEEKRAADSSRSTRP
eukprot:3968854-Amphidinium_carterae.1